MLHNEVVLNGVDNKKLPMGYVKPIGSFLCHQLVGFTRNVSLYMCITTHGVFSFPRKGNSL